MLRNFFIIIIAVFYSQTSMSGPWLLGEKNANIEVGSVWTTFDSLWLGDRSEVDIADNEYVNQYIRYSYGLKNWLQISAVVPYELSSSDNGPDSQVKGFGDGKLSLTFRILEEIENPLALSIKLEYKTPLFDYPTNQLNSFGDGQDDIDVTLLGGKYLILRGAVTYYTFDLGYRFRDGTPANEVFGNLEFGMLFTDTLSGRIFTSYVNSLDGIDLGSPEFAAIRASDPSSAFPSLEEDFAKVGVGLSYNFTKGVDLSAFYAESIRGINTSLEEHVGIALSLSF